jgi:hypothetical protein
VGEVAERCEVRRRTSEHADVAPIPGEAVRHVCVVQPVAVGIAHLGKHGAEPGVPRRRGRRARRRAHVEVERKQQGFLNPVAVQVGEGLVDPLGRGDPGLEPRRTAVEPQDVPVRVDELERVEAVAVEIPRADRLHQRARVHGLYGPESRGVAVRDHRPALVDPDVRDAHPHVLQSIAVQVGVPCLDVGVVGQGDRRAPHHRGPARRVAQQLHGGGREREEEHLARPISVDVPGRPELPVAREGKPRSEAGVGPGVERHPCEPTRSDVVSSIPVEVPDPNGSVQSVGRDGDGAGPADRSTEDPALVGVVRVRDDQVQEPIAVEVTGCGIGTERAPALGLDRMAPREPEKGRCSGGGDDEQDHASPRAERGTSEADPPPSATAGHPL